MHQIAHKLKLTFFLSGNRCKFVPQSAEVKKIED